MMMQATTVGHSTVMGMRSGTGTMMSSYKDVSALGMGGHTEDLYMGRDRFVEIREETF